MSDDLLYPKYDITSEQIVGQLPIRGEKRLIVIQGNQVTQDSTLVSSSNMYEALSFAKKTLTDYVTIRLPGRFKTSNPLGYDVATNGDFIYRFLVNPKTISIAHQTADSHSMTRGGWQFGVWGEDTIDLNIVGVTAGQYFDPGLTDRWSEYSISYRNLMELLNIFENNGYYFEGEPAIPSVYDGDFSRKRIKMHQDVELRVGNFIWKGMFTNMTIEMLADTPFLVKFSLGFLAWRETYVESSPWISPKGNKYRGHSQEVVASRTPTPVKVTPTLSPESQTAINNALAAGAGPVNVDTALALESSKLVPAPPVDILNGSVTSLLTICPLPSPGK